MDVLSIVHLPIGIIAGAVGWARTQVDVRGRERAVARREQSIASRTERLAELETAERNLANQRWGGLEVDVPSIVTAYWQPSGRVDLTLQFRVRNRRAVRGFVETIQSNISWPRGVVAALESKRVDIELSPASAHDFSRAVQWTVAEDQLQWLTGSTKQVPDISTGAVQWWKP